MCKNSILLLLSMTISGIAISAPVANLKVQGSITPPTCTIQGQNEVDVAYQFDITPGIFPASGNLKLSPESKNIQIVCDAVTYLAFDVSDNRADTELAAGDNNFGLGLYDTETKIGYYSITMKNATTQKSPESEIINVGVKTGTTHNTSSLLSKTQSAAWSISSSELAPGQMFAADFEITPTINSKMKNSAGDAELDGHATLAFKFGL